MTTVSYFVSVYCIRYYVCIYLYQCYCNCKTDKNKKGKLSRLDGGLNIRRMKGRAYDIIKDYCRYYYNRNFFYIGGAYIYVNSKWEYSLP